MLVICKRIIESLNKKSKKRFLEHIAIHSTMVVCRNLIFGIWGKGQAKFFIKIEDTFTFQSNLIKKSKFLINTRTQSSLDRYVDVYIITLFNVYIKCVHSIEYELIVACPLSNKNIKYIRLMSVGNWYQ